MIKSTDLDNRYQGIRVAVLGASGFVGRWVARRLRMAGAGLYLVVRHKAAAKQIFSKYQLRGTIVEQDLQDFDRVRKLFHEIKPSIIFNLAGYGVKHRVERDEKTAYQINAHLVQTICEAIAETRDPDWLGQDLVHVGSAAEYGALSGNLAEDSPPNPTTLYGKSKLAGTQALARCCRTQGIKGLTARAFSIYGPGEHEGRLLPLLLAVSRSGKALPLTAGSQQRDFIYVEDVAEGLLRLGLATAKPGEIVNLATGKLSSVRSFVEAAARILQIPEDRLQFGSISIPAEVKEWNQEHAPVTVERLRRLTAWLPPTRIAEGVQATLDFENMSGARSN